MRGFLKSLATDRINPRRGPRYEGIEVFKAVVGGEPRYYIGSRPISSYKQFDQSGRDRNPVDSMYGDLIRSKLNGLESEVSVGGAFDGVTFLNQEQFDKFEKKFPPAPSSAAAAAEEDEPNPNRRVILENVPGSGKMILHFGPTSDDLTPDRPLKIPIRSPPSGNSPVNELIFLGNASGITVTFVMNKNETTYCALWTYDRRTQHLNTDQIDYEVPSITKPLVLKNEHQNDITDQIIPIIDQLVEASNGCDLDASREYYANDAHHVNETIKRQILALFPRTSLASRMSTVELVKTKPSALEYTVLLNLNNKRLDACARLIDEQPDSVISSEKKGELKAHIQKLKTELSVNSANIVELNRLDEEIGTFVRLDFNKLLVKAKRAAAMGAAARSSSDQ
jgi:hypothetical protein